MSDDDTAWPQEPGHTIELPRGDMTPQEIADAHRDAEIRRLLEDEDTPQ